MVLLVYFYGLNYIVLKIEGLIRECVCNYVQLFYWVFYFGLVLFVVFLYFKIDFFSNYLIVMIIMVLVIVVLVVLVYVLIFKGVEMIVFLVSGFSFVLVVVLLF